MTIYSLIHTSIFFVTIAGALTVHPQISSAQVKTQASLNDTIHFIQSAIATRGSVHEPGFTSFSSFNSLANGDFEVHFHTIDNLTSHMDTTQEIHGNLKDIDPSAIELHRFGKVSTLLIQGPHKYDSTALDQQFMLKQKMVVLPGETRGLKGFSGAPFPVGVFEIQIEDDPSGVVGRRLKSAFVQASILSGGMIADFRGPVDELIKTAPLVHNSASSAVAPKQLPTLREGAASQFVKVKTESKGIGGDPAMSAGNITTCSIENNHPSRIILVTVEISDYNQVLRAESKRTQVITVPPAAKVGLFAYTALPGSLSNQSATIKAAAFK